MSHPFKKRITTLKFDDVIDALRQRMRDIPDPRSGSNTRYSMEQIGMAAFSVFFTQRAKLIFQFGEERPLTPAENARKWMQC